jgi:PST family polysaccharide transporter
MITEAFSVASLYFLSIYFIRYYGAKGATIAHFFSYCLYYVLVLAIFYKPLFGKLPINKKNVN